MPTKKVENSTKTAQASQSEVRRQQMTGVVTSDKMKDTVVVTVTSYVKHPKYQKFMNRRHKYMAHDAGNTKKIGDKVTIEACRPMSKNKTFKVVA